jgi:hypothetical protein
MFWTTTCRVLATLVTFSIGCAVFEIAKPTEELWIPDPIQQILEITLKRHGCSDAGRKCPVYEATFRSDGTCTYIGYANDEFIGKYEGRYDVNDFTPLAQLVEKHGLFESPHVVFTRGAIEETTSIEIVTSEGTKLVTTHNWANTPISLRALQAVLEQQTFEAEWEESLTQSMTVPKIQLGMGQ